MAELRNLLSFMDREDRERALRRYERMFDAAGPEGEEAVTRELGSPVRLVLKLEREYREAKEAGEKPFADADEAPVKAPAPVEYAALAEEEPAAPSELEEPELFPAPEADPSAEDVYPSAGAVLTAPAEEYQLPEEETGEPAEEPEQEAPAPEEESAEPENEPEGPEEEPREPENEPEVAEEPTEPEEEEPASQEPESEPAAADFFELEVESEPEEESPALSPEREPLTSPFTFDASDSLKAEDEDDEDEDEDEEEDDDSPGALRVTGAVFVTVPMLLFWIVGFGLSLLLGALFLALGAGVCLAGVYLARYVLGGTLTFLPDLFLVGGGALVGFALTLLFVWTGLWTLIGGFITVVRLSKKLYRGILGRREGDRRR